MFVTASPDNTRQGANMASRREFIQAGAAMAATALPSLSAVTAIGGSLWMYKVIYDQRFAPARRFGAMARDLNANVEAIEGDVHDLWYHDLYPRWQAAPAPIAGMTTFNPMFLLLMFAQDVGMRLIYRTNHRPAENGAVTHELFGPTVQQPRHEELSDSGTQWGSAAARIVLSWPTEATSVSPVRSNIADANRRLVGSETLLSWIIAPVRRDG
jgi:hypothetical protein